MKTWLEATIAQLSRRSDTAAAIRYALSRWPALTRFVDDGHLEIDDSAAERASRSDARTICWPDRTRAEIAPQPSPLLGSAKLNGLNPELYLHHILTQIADHPINKINELLP